MSEQLLMVCSSGDYSVTQKLESLGIAPIHTGELFTEALKSDWKVVTF